ncbi:hypothetical protein F2P79_012173 [Pimephales promelas]|nr:hypothetical protein F2P79_012173 [Pimephales promelas]
MQQDVSEVAAFSVECSGRGVTTEPYGELNSEPQEHQIFTHRIVDGDTRLRTAQKCNTLFYLSHPQLY